MFRNFEPYAVNPLSPATPILITTGLVGQAAPASASSAEPAVAAEPAILDTVWTASELGATPIAPRARPSLTIGNDLRAGGSGGCNSWFAQVELDGDSIRFGGVTATRNACAAGGQSGGGRPTSPPCRRQRPGGIDGDELSSYFGVYKTAGQVTSLT